MRIAITHSTQENPVSGGGTVDIPPRWEEQLTEPSAEHAAALLRAAGHEARSDWPHTRVGDVIRAVQAWGADLVIDLHTDATGSTTPGKGTTVLWYPGSVEGQRLGQALAARVALVSGRLRGAYARPDLGVLAAPGYTGVIVELDFHDSAERAKLVWDRRLDFGAAVAQAALDYLGEGKLADTPAPPVVPPLAVTRPRLVVDGKLGPETRKALQRWLKVDADGILGPITVRALQDRLGVRVDGKLGPITIKALQTFLRVRADGDWGPNTTRALQTFLNAYGPSV